MHFTQDPPTLWLVTTLSLRSNTHSTFTVTPVTLHNPDTTPQYHSQIVSYEHNFHNSHSNSHHTNTITAQFSSIPIHPHNNHSAHSTLSSITPPHPRFTNTFTFRLHHIIMPHSLSRSRFTNYFISHQHNTTNPTHRPLQSVTTTQLTLAHSPVTSPIPTVNSYLTNTHSQLLPHQYPHSRPTSLSPSLAVRDTAPLFDSARMPAHSPTPRISPHLSWPVIVTWINFLSLTHTKTYIQLIYINTIWRGIGPYV